MATQTTYYGFNKPSGTDLVNPLVDTNPNWDIADASLHELNERSICNCTEVVSLGVHTLSTLNTDTKFLKWIATANFTAGDTFVLNGDAIAASTPSGSALQTNAFVSGSVVLACLNADNSAMTIYVSGTTVADDSARLGGELPSYYAKDSDMNNARTDITNMQNLLGNNSIVGIGDGTVTGAILALEGNKMKTYYGTVSITTSTSADVNTQIDISSLGLSNADDYFIIIDNDTMGVDYSGTGWNGGINITPYISAKTANNFTLTVGRTTNSRTTKVSYQVVYSN